MDRTELTKRIKSVGLTQKDFAELIGYSYQAVKQWKDGRIPKWVPMLLDHLELIRHNEHLARQYGLRLPKELNK